MAQLSSDELVKYGHSPAHYAVARRDHAGLRRLISRLPKLAEAGEIKTEAESIREEQRADEIAAVLDRRDVPRRETPLHLAVRISDATAAEILMEAGANWSLQNDQGWSALQEAICFRRDDIAKVIIKHYQPMAWAKWCRRLPRLISCMRRMRDFYMEIAFHFESSVIPFVGRIAPSDTYRIWKRDANLRADTTLAGFDGFKIQRSEQSFLFLGEGSDDGRVPAGSLLMLSHKDKEIMNAFEDAGHRPTDSEVAQEAAAMAQTNVYRPGIDVTRAELLPQFNWRRQEKVEMVGTWKSRVYDMHHVMLSFKSRKVPCSVHEESNMDLELLTEDERRQVDNALRINDELDLDLDADVEDGFLVAERPADMRPHRHSSYDRGDFYLEKKERFTFSSSSSKNANFELQFSKEEKEWVLGRRSFDRSGCPVPNKNAARPSKNSMSDLLGSRHFSKKSELQQGRRSMDVKRSDFMGAEDGRKWVGKEQSGRRRGSESNNGSSGGGQENVYKKGLRPVLWLTPHFPLKTEELLPLLDILADKVKAVRRLRELLTTKLPTGTFPIKVAIPVVPTIRVVITFSKFEELPPSEEFCTPPSSPAHLQDLIAKESQTSQESSNSWFQWIKGPSNKSTPVSASPEDQQKEVQDPFAIPADYTWTTLDAKKRQMKEKKSKAKKGKKSHSVDVSDNVVER